MKTVSHLGLFLALTFVSWLSYYTHYKLPEPKTELYDAAGEPQFSEAQALKYCHILADEIGYRIVGTKEHVDSRDWLKTEVIRLIKELEDDPDRNALYEVEMLNHSGEGSHRFDFMAKVVMKQYIDIENVVVRISSRVNPASKDNAILVNGHLDSTLPSPGAADDGLAIAIQLETLRIITSRTNVKQLDNSIILLFNDAEESLQDASHMFITQHPWAKTVRAMINLEAAGNTGPSILFQATSSKMIEAYSYAPHPYGTVLASDIFKTGLILSDTDFRQFDQYGNLTGLDMAVVGNSYAYHTRLDTTANIERGSAQQFGENTIAILTYLIQEGTRIDDIHSARDEDPDPQTYFSVLHRRFVTYSTAKAVFVARIAFTIILGYIGYTTLSLLDLAKGLALTLISLISSLIFSNVIAITLTFGNLQMRWFTHEFSCLAIYIPASIVGVVIPQLFMKVSPRYIQLSALLLYSCLSLLPIGSAFWMFYQSIFLFASLLLFNSSGSPSFTSFLVGSIQAGLFGTEAYWSVLEIFVPLTGRLGIDSPAENIIAIIVCVLTFMSWPMLPTYIATLTRTSKLRMLFTSSIAMLAAIGVLSSWPVWDAAHPRRMFVQYLYNVTDSTTSLHFANADPAPGFNQYIEEIRQKLDLGPIEENQMDEWISDWDTIYPFSQFLNSYKIQLDGVQDQSDAVKNLQVTGKVLGRVDVGEDDVVSVEITVDHPGLIWTVISFDAELASWDLPMPEPDSKRHHVRQVSVYGTWTHVLKIEMKLPKNAPQELIIDFVGVDELGVWPAKSRNVLAQERESVKLFKRLEAEEVLAVADMCSNGVVAGRYHIPL